MSRLLTLLVLLVACEGAVTRVTSPVTSAVIQVAEVAPLEETLQQEVASGSVVGLRPTLFVRDSAGRGVRGVPVYFRPRVGSGTVTSFRTDTDALGRAQAAPWTVSNALGPQYLDAVVAVPGFAGPYTFTATSVVGPPVRLGAQPDTLVLESSANAQLDVTATDLGGHLVPLADGALTFSTSNAAVATVSASGEIVAGGGGLAFIRATLGALVVEVPVAVDAPAVADFLVTVPSSPDALSLVIFEDDLVLAGVPDGFGYRARVPFPGASPWSMRWVRDIAYVPGESNYYVAGRNSSGSASQVRSHSRVDSSVVTLLQTGHTLLSLVVDPVNDWLFVGRSDGLFFRINRLTQAVDSVALDGPIFGMAPHSANRSVFVTSGNILYELNGETLAVLRSEDFGTLLIRAALVASDTHLIVVRHYYAASVLDRATLAPVATLSDSPGGYDLKVHPSGDRFAISSNSETTSGRVVEYEVGSWATRRIIPLFNPLRLAYSASGYVLMATQGYGASMLFLR